MPNQSSNPFDHLAARQSFQAWADVLELDSVALTTAGDLVVITQDGVSTVVRYTMSTGRKVRA